jgi:hypothetical protein
MYSNLLSGVIFPLKKSTTAGTMENHGRPVQAFQGQWKCGNTIVARVKVITKARLRPTVPRKIEPATLELESDDCIFACECVCVQSKDELAVTESVSDYMDMEAAIQD